MKRFRNFELSWVIIGVCSLVHPLILLGCDDPQACQSDSDCREGYRCDLEVYVGECIKKIPAVRCGNDYCIAPEICVDGIRCEVVERRDRGVGGDELPLAGQVTGGMSGGSMQGGSMQGGSMQGGSMQGGSMQGGSMQGGNSGGIQAGMEMGGDEVPDLGLRDMYVDPLTRDQGGQACQSACDCTPGLACLSGICEATPSPVYCCGSNFCPAGEACQAESGVRDVCLDSTCETACDCQPGLSCIQGSCELGSGPLFCCDQGSCPSGMRCESMRGVFSMCPSDECQTACDCSAGQRCEGGSCVLGDELMFCCENTSCPSGASCQTMSGQFEMCSASVCETACDCMPGLSCISGECRLGQSPVFCCGSSQCPLGERCENSGGGPIQLCE